MKKVILALSSICALSASAGGGGWSPPNGCDLKKLETPYKCHVLVKDAEAADLEIVRYTIVQRTDIATQCEEWNTHKLGDTYYQLNLTVKPSYLGDDIQKEVWSVYPVADREMVPFSGSTGTPPNQITVGPRTFTLIGDLHYLRWLRLSTQATERGTVIYRYLVDGETQARSLEGDVVCSNL